MITITVSAGGVELDLMVPSEVTFDRLVQLVGEAYLRKGLEFPMDASIRPVDKALSYGEFDEVSAFGFSDGDRFEIYG